MSILKQLNSRKESQNKKLFDAVTNGHIDVVKSLIKSGADVNVAHKDRLYDHCTCLYNAIRKGYLEISQVLIEAGADVNAPVYMLLLRQDQHRISPCYPLDAAINSWESSVDAIKLLLQNGANIYPKKNWNPLFKICCIQKSKNPKYNEVLFECCKELVKAGVEVNYTSNYDYSTPLSFASINGHIKIVHLLIKYGATLDLASSFILEKYECVKFFLNKADAAFTNNIGALLCKAIKNNNSDLVTKIINYGINLNITVPSTPEGHLKRCPLDCAREYETVKLLLENGADPNYILDGEKHSHILCSIVSADSIEVLRLLLHYKANPNQQDNDHNITALQSAISSSLPYQKAKILLDAGANINARDSNGLSAMHYMCNYIYFPEFAESAFCSLSEIAKTLDLLLNYKANPNLKDNNGNTPLHLAVSNNYSNTLLKQLIKAEAHIYTQNYFGETVLDLAIQTDNKEHRKGNNKEAIHFLSSLNVKCNILTKLLYKETYDFLKELDNIEDTEIKDSDYNTLLHYAIKKESFIILKKLIHNGVQINCANSYMQTALDLAIMQKNNQLIEYLKIYDAKEANEIFKCRYIYYYLPKDSGTVVINYDLESKNNRIIEVDPKNLLSTIPGKSLNKLQKHILLEVFDYISSIFRIKFNLTEEASETNLFIGNVDEYNNNGYTIKRYISKTSIIRSSLIFDLNSDIDNNHLFSIFLQCITKTLGLIEYVPKEPSVLAPITNFTQRISYSELDLYFLSSRYKFNKELSQQPTLPNEHHNNSLIASIKLAIKQHDLKKLIPLINSIDDLNYKDNNGNSLIKMASIVGFIEGTEFLYKKGAELDLASALILELFDEATKIANQQDALENYKQLDQLMLIATLRENIPLLKALINYGVQIDDDILLLSIEIQNFDIIKMFISGGANVMAVNQESEGILAIASKLGCSDETIKFLQESINNNKSKIPSNIIDFKTSRIINL